ncbi:MAG: hypothetical protein A2008_05285 [Candidatus Wallbacteria bacterium GWC2_49_35]|uniref:Uncharacterized protein n=1 Tax=Candidatus Wallbacteria bacterium GWC2_49_35 TaxID=1817813 RepID=A0A1F7WUH1_9BACT|nr:MAG: hypothetical protein A2008_05285 [Candidatus Wallbacteria bacterium GWC2_49_35]HBC76562.1 hypothetical protein [Candidatus Wallbacteria bacterium]
MSNNKTVKALDRINNFTGLDIAGRAMAGPYFFMAVLMASMLWSAVALAAQTPSAEWTYLVFLNDGAASAPREINRLENISQDGFINIIALWYNKKDGIKTVYKIIRDSDPSKISSPVMSRGKISGNADLNSELAGFVIKYYLSEKTNGLMLTLYDRETVIDNKPSAPVAVSGRWNGVKGLRSAFEKIRSATGRTIDVLHFDADHFQCLELIYELGEYAPYIVGSEESVPDAGTPYDTMINPIVAQKITSPHRFSFLFVSGWHNYFKKFARGTVKATLSAVKTAELPMISEKLDILLGYLKPVLAENKYRELFDAAVIKRVRRYRGGEFIDAFDFGRLINEEIHEPTVEQGSREYLASLTNATVKNSAIGDYEKIPGAYNSFGMAVYMPVPAPKFEGYDSLSIAGRTGWKKFLDYFYSFSLGKGYGN